MAGRTERALALIAESSAVLDDLDLPQAELWRAETAQVRELCGDIVGAARELERMQERFRGDLRALRATTELARLHCDSGRFDQAVALLVAAGDTGDFEDSRGTATRRLAVEARVAAHEGRLAEALALGAKAVARAETWEGYLNLRAGALAAYGEVLRAAGRADEAGAANDRALALYEQKGNVAAASALRSRALT
jgi:tetratricopeptide (TPR) repeat protein